MSVVDDKQNLRSRVSAWGVHLFTASGGVLGVFTLVAIHRGDYRLAFWFMISAVVVDALDGTFARKLSVKTHAPEIDGALLDNLMDFLNYVVAPSFFLLVSNLLPPVVGETVVAVIIVVSGYQLSQTEAKTKDHFFRGFPCYWNIAVFYLYFWQTSPIVNVIILLLLSVLVFVPIKYVYPSRLDYFARNRLLRQLMLLATVFYGVATAGLIWVYPDAGSVFVVYSACYVLLYIAVSVYRTFSPLTEPGLD